MGHIHRFAAPGSLASFVLQNAGMGILVPENFPLASLANSEERMVVEAFRDRLTDGWLVIPNVGLTGDRDRQMDIVLVHERDGIAVVEVKGHQPSIRNGLFLAHGSVMDPQPLLQAKNNSYALRELLRSSAPEFEHLRVEYAVAFPNALTVTGTLPPDINGAQILTSNALEDPQAAIDTLMAYRWGNQPLGPEGMNAVVKILRPNADFVWDPEARARLARARLEQICGQHVRVLERLDANRRVVVTGAAGTGKTRLALAWARRAHFRNERVLLTCYNDPLGDRMQSLLVGLDRITVGPFFRLALQFEGLPPLDTADEHDPAFWDYTVVGHLQRNWHHITQRFDTIVIDEAQDLSPASIALLTQLLDPDGPRRMMMVADQSQTLYDRGFSLPTNDDGFVRCELVNNCRNTGAIAAMIRKQLGGAPPPVGGPETIDITWLPADDVDVVYEHVGNEIDRIVDGEGHEPPRVLFATFNRALRDQLRDQFGFVQWEAGGSRAIVCETVHRMKGLEFDYVVLVAAPNDHVSDALLYVGASRAISGLSVIAPSEVGARLGLT